MSVISLNLLETMVILEINKDRIANLDDYRDTMDGTEPGQNVLFLVQRGTNTIYVALKADSDDNKG